MKNICSRQIGKIPQVGIKIKKHLKPPPLVLLMPSRITNKRGRLNPPLNSFLCWGPFWAHCSTQNSNGPPNGFIPNVTPNTSNWGEKHHIYTWRFLPFTCRRQRLSFWRCKINWKKIKSRQSHQSLQWYLIHNRTFSWMFSKPYKLRPKIRNLKVEGWNLSFSVAKLRKTITLVQHGGRKIFPKYKHGVNKKQIQGQLGSYTSWKKWIYRFYVQNHDC